MKVLLIEDQPDLASSILEFLRENFAQCDCAVTKADASDKLEQYEYDCILLDLTLPDGSGFDILNEIASSNRNEGVIVISAAATLENRLKGLQLRADDFLAKPFHLSELLARIQAIMRRKNFDNQNQVQFENIEVNVLSRETTVSGNKIDLTRKETDLLLYLIGNRNRVLSKNAIAEHLSGDLAEAFDNYDVVYAHIKNLKKKLQAGGGGDYIKTVYGIGYKWSL